MTRTTLTAGAVLLASVAPALGAVDDDFVYVDRRGADAELVARSGGGSTRVLTSNRSADYYPAWSPDGTQIAFVSDRAGGDEDIFVMNADGSEVRLLTRDGGTSGRRVANDTAPSWSPDGGRIAFASDRDGGEHEIYVMGADGSRQRRVTRTARHVIDTTPSWSPDGKLIAFASSRSGYFNLEIYVVRPDGIGARRLTRTGGSDGVLGDDATPAWSPDGSRIAFASNRDRNNEIYVMKADGTGQRRLTRSANADDLLPHWTADGRQIVFTSMRRDGSERLLVVPAAGGPQSFLALGAEASLRSRAS